MSEAICGLWRRDVSSGDETPTVATPIRYAQIRMADRIRGIELCVPYSSQVSSS